MVIQSSPRRARPVVVALLTLFAVTACDVLLTTPFPDFLGYTDITLDLGGRIDAIWSGAGSIDYRMEVVVTETDDPRLLLLVEPPTESGSSGFQYRGRLLVFDADLNLLNTTAPLTEIDTFGRPFVYGPDGNILVGNTILDGNDGSAVETLPFLGLEGPGVTVLGFTSPPAQPDPSAVVFSLPAGEFTGFDLEWVRYSVPIDEWLQLADGILPILPPGNRPSSAADGFQVLSAAFHATDDQVTLLLSQPSVPRVVAVRFSLPALLDGTLGELVPSMGAFPVSIDADRPLDTHTTMDGFLLRRRDGWFDYYRWTPSGPLELVGSRQRIVGDRSFNRTFAFLASGGQQYMYRFDPASRILTRYRRWW